MPQLPAPSTETRLLKFVKVAHTLVWGFFAACIVPIPIVSLLGEHSAAGWLAAVVLIEVVVLACNDMSCPLTAVAARYTADRRPNFDIYMPAWLAKYNKVIFGTLYVAGATFALGRWLSVVG